MSQLLLSILGHNNCAWGGDGDDCCMKPLGEKEGDCDSDNDCKGSLVCGTDNCPAGYPMGDDCCKKP